MQHLPTFAGGPGRPPGAQTRGWLFMKNTILISTIQEVVQYSMLCYAGAAERGAGEEERRRDEGTGDGAKEVARTAGGKAAGARVIGG